MVLEAREIQEARMAKGPEKTDDDDGVSYLIN